MWMMGLGSHFGRVLVELQSRKGDLRGFYNLVLTSVSYFTSLSTHTGISLSSTFEYTEI